jgi:AraC family transcriptional regulator
MTTRPVREITLRDYKQRLLRVLVYIQEHLDERLPLEELAERACLSPYHFHHVFSGMLGESLQGYIRRLRLERAAWRLKLSGEQVVQIALEAGYQTHEAFTRAFRASFGISPTRFRRRHGAFHGLRARSGIHFNNTGKLSNFKTENIRRMNVAIKHLKPLRVAFVRHVGPYNEVGKTWEQFMTFLGKEGWLGGDTQCIGICHDDPAVTPPGRLRYDACINVDIHFQPGGDVGVREIGGGDYAVTTHFGPYQNLGASYAKLLGQWLPRSGRDLGNAPCFEVYLNSPESSEPEDLVTDIYAPLAPAVPVRKTKMAGWGRSMSSELDIGQHKAFT